MAAEGVGAAVTGAQCAPLSLLPFVWLLSDPVKEWKREEKEKKVKIK